MRPVRLAKIAAEAEGLRLRGLLTRIATRAVFAIVAFLFILGALVFLHIAAWYSIRTGLNMSFLAATGIVGGADLLIAIVLGILASRSTPSRVEIESLEVRRNAIQAMGSTLSVAQMLLPALRVATNLRRRKR